MEKRISVVIPVYSAERSLQKCLESIFSSNYKNFEVIIVDDCSGDNSIEIAKKYPCKIINLSERRGPAFARDKSLSQATGEIIAFLDSDCIAPEDWLAKINTELSEDILGIGGKYKLPENINSISCLFRVYSDPKNIFYRKPLSLISLSGGNCAFWKSALMLDRKKKELIYCNKRIGGDDTIMCYELSKSGRLIYNSDIFVIHNKNSSLLNILKDTINRGYSGATVSALCGDALIREPHRLYKSILYLFSLFLFFSIILLPFTKQSIAYLYIFIPYIILQLPIMLLMSKYLRKRFYVLLFPAVIFITDILHFVGHIKRLSDAIQKAIKYFIWHAKLLLNIINPSALSKVFFFITKRCNANCYFCFNKKGEQTHQGKNDLSLEEIKNTTNKIGFLPWLTITGGEPFLRRDIHEICKLFYNNCGARVISIVTNGFLSLYIEETVEKLLIDCEKLNLHIIVALDDIGDRHDRIKGVKNAYTQALTTLEKLNGLRLRFPRLTLGINTILIKENADHIEEILDYFRNKLEYYRQGLGLLRQPPCSSVNPELISIQKYFDLLVTKTFNSKIVHFPHSIKQRFHQAVLEYNCKRALEEFSLKKSLGTCLAVQKFLVVNNDGAIFPCELLTDELGNLRNEEYDFRKIIKGSKAKNIGLRIRDTGCYCQWPCAVGFNGYYKISSYPKISKNIICNKQKVNI